MSHHKKLYLILLILIAAGIFALYGQIKKAREIVTGFVETPIVNPIAAYIPVDPTDPTVGNPGAALWIVEFGDWGCRRCQEVYYAITAFVKNNPEKARFIWKDAPQTSMLSWGNLPAHIAAYCTYEQGQFWQFAPLVMNDKANLKEAGLAKIAQGLGLDLERWNACRAAPATQNKIFASMALGKSLGVTDLPGLFVNNKKINLADDMNITELLTKFAAEPR